jgi:hypothetical protein
VGSASALARPPHRASDPSIAVEALGTVSAARATLVTSTTGLTVTPFGPMAMIATSRAVDPPLPPKPLPLPMDCLLAGGAASVDGDCRASDFGAGPRPKPTPKPPPQLTSAA